METPSPLVTSGKMLNPCRLILFPRDDASYVHGSRPIAPFLGTDRPPNMHVAALFGFRSTAASRNASTIVHNRLNVHFSTRCCSRDCRLAFLKPSLCHADQPSVTDTIIAIITAALRSILQSGFNIEFPYHPKILKRTPVASSITNHNTMALISNFHSRGCFRHLSISCIKALLLFALQLRYHPTITSLLSMHCRPAPVSSSTIIS
jgi:hypothetical protein